MKIILAVLRGTALPPALVGLARGLVEAAVMAGLVELAVLFQQTEWANAWWAPILWLAVRQLEGGADHIDPSKPRAP
jgi:hypothetical protein